MCISERKLNANKQNAQKSTGPTSAKGKTRSSRNAITHGLFAKDIVIDSSHLKESPEVYNRMLETLSEELRPTTLLQTFLVQKIANCIWRLQRAVRAETAHINRKLDDVTKRLNQQAYFRSCHVDDYDTIPDTPEQEELDRENMVGECLIPDDAFCKILLRYEMRINRELERAYSMLSRLQKDTPFTREDLKALNSLLSSSKMEKTTKRTHSPLSPNELEAVPHLSGGPTEEQCRSKPLPEGSAEGGGFDTSNCSRVYSIEV
ncbi:MAG TPA: hypothetical protein VMS71_07765 [Candidatus Acidoferrum sp.]|nr:hypothetical protein [Candidatus Acidoferrum sp.]